MGNASGAEVKMLISPSLLAADFSDLRNELRRIQSADMLHVDVMDGHFVPNISIGPGVIKAIRPHSGLPFDVHLMMEHPFPYIRAFASAGADNITFHPECADDTQETINEIKACGKKAGLAIKPATPAEAVFPFGEQLYIVTIMSVEPGFGGQKMIPETLKKAKEIKDRFPHILIEVDGGVSRETRALCQEAGIEVLVAGTAVFGAPSPEAEISFLKNGMD